MPRRGYFSTVPGVGKKWRVGMKVGRTIYEQQGDEPSESDPLIGLMDTPELAAQAVAAVNAARAQGTSGPA